MKKYLVVMVHGLTGGEDTWINYDNKSFSGLLLENECVNNLYDFVEFDYFTKIANVKNSMLSKNIIYLVNKLPMLNFKTPKRQKNTSILTLSKELATFIEFECNNYEHIVFMAHSMGGLISKKFILDLIDGEYEEIESKVVGYISIASPHKGALAATILGPININAKELTPLNSDINEINERWIEKYEDLPYSFYMIAKNDEYVTEVSSVPSSSKSKFKTVYLDDDHNSICKPESNKSRNYKVVEKFLLNTHDKIEQLDTLKKTYNAQEHSYDNEIFVVKMILAQIEISLVDDAKESFFHADLAIKSAPKKDREIFEQLKTQIFSMYLTYSSCSNGKSNSEIVKDIHSKIIELDRTSLSCAVQYINFLHKKGFLHQEANHMDLKINWCKKLTLSDIDKEVSTNV